MSLKLDLSVMSVAVMANAEQSTYVHDDLRWAFDYLSEVYSDAGSTPAVVTDPVRQWNDLSGNIAIVQSTEANRPVLRSDGVDWDGTDDYMTFSPGFTSTSQSYTFGIRTFLDAITGYFWDAELGRLLHFVSSGGNWAYGDPTVRGFTTAIAGLHTIVLTLNASNNQGVMRVDGVAIGSVQTYTPRNVGGAVGVGSRYSFDTAFLNGKIRRMAWYDRVLDADEITSFEGWLNKV